jgi:hypothetical protein
MAPADWGRPVTLLATRAGRVVAAGFAVASREGLHLQEAGALPGEEESLRAILDRIWAVAVAEGASSWRGRVAPGASRTDPRLQGVSRPVPAGIPMGAPLGPTTSLERLAGDPALHLLELDLI